MHESGLLSDDEHAAIRERDQHRRRAEIVVGSVRFGAIRALVADTRQVPCVVPGHLLRPFDGAGRETERENGIARGRRGIGIAVAGRHIQQPGFRVDRRRGPDGGAGRPVELRADGVLAGRLRRIENRVDVPHDRAVRRIERRDASPERAALVLRVRAGHLLGRRDRHVEAAGMKRRRPGNPRCGMLVDAPLPDERASGCVNRVNGRVDVAEVRKVAAAGLAEADRGPHHRVGVECPVRAAAPQAQ